LTKISVERWARMISSSRGWVAERRRPARNPVRLRHLGHVLDRDLDRQLQRFALSGIDDGHGAVAHRAVGRKLVLDLGIGMFALRRAQGRRAPARSSRACRGARCARLGAAEKPRDLVERPLGRRQTDALRRPLADRLEPFQRQRQVGAALARHQRVDLVDDDRVDRAQRFARIRRQQQVERFRRRDQDVGRFPLEPRPLGLRRVTGADGDCRRHERIAAQRGDLRDAGQRRAQVALDVDRERLEGRHVEHAAAGPFRWRRREHQPVEAPEKRGERLAASGRRQNQRRVAVGDCRPTERLRPRRRREGRGEPFAGCRRKTRDRINRRTDAHVLIL
jgi:hypothetical protein